MQLHMQVVRQCRVHARPRGGDVTPKCEDIMAIQKSEEKQRSPITGNGTYGCMCALRVNLSYF